MGEVSARLYFADWAAGGVNIKVEELNGGANQRCDDDFIARVDRNVFRPFVKCGGCCLHNIFLFLDERRAILGIAKATFQSVTKAWRGHKSNKKRIIFRPAKTLL